MLKMCDSHFRDSPWKCEHKKSAIDQSMALLKFLVAALTLGVEALAAVYGTIATGLERHLGGASATVADHFIHLTIAGAAGTAALGSATIGTAGRAAGGLVLKALFGEEGLLRARECEFSATLAAGQGFVLIHDGFPPSKLFTQTYVPCRRSRGPQASVLGVERGGMTRMHTWLG
jgi:hypothetical protein